jgi:hypothetical protein
MNFSNICTPAQLHVFLSFINILIAFGMGVNFLAIGFNVLFAFIWMYLLDWLCKKGWSGLSWFLVLSPFIIGLLAFFLVFSVYGKLPFKKVDNKKVDNKKVDNKRVNNKQQPKRHAKNVTPFKK